MDVTSTAALHDTGYGFQGNQGEKHGRRILPAAGLRRKINAIALASKNGNWLLTLRKGAGQPCYVDNPFYQRWQEQNRGSLDFEDRLMRAVQIWRANHIDPSGEQVETPTLQEIDSLLQDIKECVDRATQFVKDERAVEVYAGGSWKVGGKITFKHNQMEKRMGLIPRARPIHAARHLE